MVNKISNRREARFGYPEASAELICVQCLKFSTLREPQFYDKVELEKCEEPDRTGMMCDRNGEPIITTEGVQEFIKIDEDIIHRNKKWEEKLYKGSSNNNPTHWRDWFGYED